MKEFKQWARQFCLISHQRVSGFLTVNRSKDLHELKRLFSRRYQNKIEISYILQVEKNLINKHLDIRKFGYWETYHNCCYGQSYTSDGRGCGSFFVRNNSSSYADENIWSWKGTGCLGSKNYEPYSSSYGEWGDDYISDLWCKGSGEGHGGELINKKLSAVYGNSSQFGDGYGNECYGDYGGGEGFGQGEEE